MEKVVLALFPVTTKRKVLFSNLGSDEFKAFTESVLPFVGLVVMVGMVTGL